MTSISKSTDGRYHATVYLGKDPSSGKKITKSIAAKTRKEAAAKVQEVLNQKNKVNIEKTEDDATFEEWVNRWLPHKKASVGFKQIQSYESRLNRVLPRFGQRKLQSIQTYEIQQFIDELYSYNSKTGKSTSKKTLSGYVQLFSTIFEFALKNRAIDFNPAKYVTIPQHATVTERRALTADERQWIENTPHRIQAAAMIMLYGGLRRGETLALLWDDIDLNKRTINVNKAVSFIGGKPIIKNPKTKAGVRSVFICDKLFNFLNEYKQHAPSNRLVCPSLNGEIFTETSFRRAWQSFQRELNITSGLNPYRKSKYDPRFKSLEIDNITPHLLRHSFCTLMYENHVDVKTAQYEMGHASPQITLSIYTHLSSSFALEEMQKMNSI